MTFTTAQIAAFERLTTNGEVWASNTALNRPHTNTLRSMAKRGWFTLQERYHNGLYDWFYIYKITDAGRNAFKQAEKRTEGTPHYPGALTDVQVQIIQGHARRGQTFAALAAYNRYRHGHEV